MNNIATPETITGYKLKSILLDNRNWWRFFCVHGKTLRSSILENVIKVLSCGTALLGFEHWECQQCGTHKILHFTCKSRFCSSCGKKATENWINQQLHVLPNTPWQHITFTLPAQLRPLFWLNRHLFNEIIPIPAKIITELCSKKKAKPGIFLALHTFGRDLKRNVHFHVSRTLGGLSNDQKSWLPSLYLHHQSVKNRWKTQVCQKIKALYHQNKLTLPKELQHLTNPPAFNRWIDSLYQKNWVVHLQKPSHHHHRNVKYLGRYLKRPPLSEMRIKNYDGQHVTFNYLDHHNNTKTKQTLTVFDFIKRLITHIPDKHFRLVRYYNWLSNRTRQKALPIVYRLLKINVEKNQPISWRELFIRTFKRDPLHCHQCNLTMRLTHTAFGPPLSILFLKHQSIATNA